MFSKTATTNNNNNYNIYIYFFFPSKQNAPGISLGFRRIYYPLPQTVRPSSHSTSRTIVRASTESHPLNCGRFYLQPLKRNQMKTE